MEIALFHIKRACRYRVQLFMDIANVMLNFLVQYYLWTAVLSSNRLFFEDKNRMIVYYFYISLLSVLMRCNASDIADAFKNGKMDRELIRPVNVFALKMYENIFSNLFLFLCSFPLLSLLTFLGFGMKMQVNMNGLLLFLLAVFPGYLLHYCLYFLVGLTALLIDEVWAIRGIVGFCMNMIAGYYLPVEMFPDWISKALEYTPFYYIYYFPTLIISNFRSLEKGELLWKYILMSGWVLILLGISQFAFKKLVKNYTAYGG